jgi:hypothetical protein
MKNFLKFILCIVTLLIIAWFFVNISNVKGKKPENVAIEFAKSFHAFDEDLLQINEVSIRSGSNFGELIEYRIKQNEIGECIVSVNSFLFFGYQPVAYEKSSE